MENEFYIGLYSVIFLIIIIIVFFSERRELQSTIKYLEKENCLNESNAKALASLVQNLLLENDLSLIKLSKLSRDFFNESDLLEFKWDKSTPYTKQDFFYKERVGPDLISIPDKMNKEELDNINNDSLRDFNQFLLQDWNTGGREENLRLMELRRNFFIKHFLEKFIPISNRYNLENNLPSNELQDVFIKKFTNLIKLSEN